MIGLPAAILDASGKVLAANALTSVVREPLPQAESPLPVRAARPQGPRVSRLFDAPSAWPDGA